MRTGLLLAFVGTSAVLALGAGPASRAAAPLPVAPPAPAPAERCEDVARCDYATGAGCGVEPPETLTIYPHDAETFARLEAYAESCQGRPWEGADGCLKGRLEAALAGLVGTLADHDELVARALLLPQEAGRICAGAHPANARGALEEASGWCAMGREECIEALREVRRVLLGMPAWVECLERMEAYAQENARNALAHEHCLATSRNDDHRSDTPAPSPTPALAPSPTPALAPSPTPTLEPSRSPALGPSPTPALAPTPTPALAPTPRARPLVVIATPVPDRTPLADTPPSPHPDTSTLEEIRTAPRAVDDGRRDGQFEITVVPLSGVLRIRDPATGAEHRPLIASIGAGLDVALALSEDIALELGLSARGSFASTAMGQAATATLDELETETGSAVVIELEPTVALLSQYVGAGLVVGVRWDTIGVTSLENGLASHATSGAAAGLRLLLGLGLLERDLRLVGHVDYLFVGTEETVLRAGVQADLGPLLVSGDYRQHFRLGAPDQAWLVDELQLTLGYRGAF